MMRHVRLQWLLAAVALGSVGCLSSVVVTDSRHPEAASRQKPKWTALSAGPRVGAVYVTGPGADTLKQELGVGPVLGVFGWQFEFLYEIEGSDLVGIVELVPLALGLEQGTFLPSGSALIGLRTGEDWEFAVGPNLSLSGIGFIVAIGKTLRSGALSIPVNISVASGDDGVRYAITVGGNLRQ